MFSIIGSGFALYGYLPAVIRQLDMDVLLLQRSRPSLINRPELAKYYNRIIWVETVDELINQSSRVIVAVPPATQLQILNRVMDSNNIKQVVLEKPLSPTPKESQSVLDRLYNSAVQFRIGYTFLYTEWFNQLLQSDPVRNSIGLNITWKFKAHHFITSSYTWKRYHSQGGGVINFYSIHLFAVLSALGYTTVNSANVREYARDQPVALCASFAGDNLPKCQVLVDSDSDSCLFEIGLTVVSGINVKLYSRQDPFDRVKHDSDIRISLLQNLLASFYNLDNPFLNKAQNYQTIALWQQVFNYYRED